MIRCPALGRYVEYGGFRGAPCDSATTTLRVHLLEDGRIILGVSDPEVNMSIRYTVVSGTVFGFIAAAQAVRALRQLPVQAGEFEIPVWLSWVAAAIAGSLCVWAFRTRS